MNPESLPGVDIITQLTPQEELANAYSPLWACEPR